MLVISAYICRSAGSKRGDRLQNIPESNELIALDTYGNHRVWGLQDYTRRPSNGFLGIRTGKSFIISLRPNWIVL